MPEVPDPSQWLDFLKPALEANWYTNFGPVNSRFEERLHTLYGREDEGVVTACNATSGLSACLIAENITGPVLCPAFTFQATAAAILGANCSPLIVDVDVESGIVTPAALEEAFLQSDAQAAIVLAPYGITTSFHAHEAICRKMGRLLIIDNAAGLGVARGELAFCGEGDVVREVFSLHATKPFGIGEGCAIFAPHSKIASIRAAMNFGLQTHTSTGDRQPPYWGINGKLSEFHAAIGLAVADGMAERVSGRQNMATNWVACLQDSPAALFNTVIESSPWQVFPILLDSTEHVIETVKKAQEHGIELRRYYSPSLGACQGMAQIGPCTNARSLADRALALPVRSFMAAAQQDELMSTVRTCIVQTQDELST